MRCVVGHGSIGPIRREVVVHEGEVQGWGWGNLADAVSDFFAVFWSVIRVAWLDGV